MKKIGFIVVCVACLMGAWSSGVYAQNNQVIQVSGKSEQKIKELEDRVEAIEALLDKVLANQELIKAEVKKVKFRAR